MAETISIGSIEATITLMADQFQKSINSVTQQLKDFQAKADSSIGGGVQKIDSHLKTGEGAMRRFGRVMETEITTIQGHAIKLNMLFMGLGGGILAGLGKAATAGSGFEQMLSRVAANTNMSTKELVQMRGALVAMGQTSPASLEQLSQGYMHIANIFGTKDLAGNMSMLTAAMKSAVSTGGDVGGTADVLAKAMDQFHIKTKYAANAMNELHTAAALGDMTLEQFVENAGPVLGLAANLGVKFYDVNAAISTLTKTFGAAGAATQVQDMMIHIKNPTDQVLNVINNLQPKFKQLLLNDFTAAGLKTKSLSGVLGDLAMVQKACGVSVDQFIPALRGGIGATILAGTSAKSYADHLTALKTALNTTKDTDDAYTRALQQQGAATDILKNNLLLLSDRISVVLSPVIKQAIDIASEMARAFLALPQPVQDSIVKFTAIAAAVLLGVGALTKIIGVVEGLAPLFAMITGWVAKLAPLFGELSAGAALVGEAFVGAGGGVAGLAAGFSGFVALIGGPVTLVIAAVVAAIALLVAAWKNDWGGIREATGAALKDIQENLAAAWKWVVDTTKEAWNDVKGVFGEVWDRLKSILTSSLGQMLGFYVDTHGQIRHKTTETWAAIVQTVRVVLDLIHTYFKVGWDAIVAVLGAAWAIIKGLTSAAGNFLVGNVKIFMDLLHGDWKAAWNDVKETASRIWADIVGMFTELGHTLENLWSSLCDDLTSMWDKLWGHSVAVAQDGSQKIQAAVAQADAAQKGAPGSPGGPDGPPSPTAQQGAGGKTPAEDMFDHSQDIPGASLTAQQRHDMAHKPKAHKAAKGSKAHKARHHKADQGETDDAVGGDGSDDGTDTAGGGKAGRKATARAEGSLNAAVMEHVNDRIPNIITANGKVQASCAHWASTVFRHAGAQIGHIVGAAALASAMRRQSTPVPREEAEPGDFVHLHGRAYGAKGARKGGMGDHVGIYIGGGRYKSSSGGRLHTSPLPQNAEILRYGGPGGAESGFGTGGDETAAAAARKEKERQDAIKQAKDEIFKLQHSELQQALHEAQEKYKERIKAGVPASVARKEYNLTAAKALQDRLDHVRERSYADIDAAIKVQEGAAKDSFVADHVAKLHRIYADSSKEIANARREMKRLGADYTGESPASLAAAAHQAVKTENDRFANEQIHTAEKVVERKAELHQIDMGQHIAMLQEELKHYKSYQSEYGQITAQIAALQRERLDVGRQTGVIGDKEYMAGLVKIWQGLPANTNDAATAFKGVESGADAVYEKMKTGLQAGTTSAQAMRDELVSLTQFFGDQGTIGQAAFQKWTAALREFDQQAIETAHTLGTVSDRAFVDRAAEAVGQAVNPEDQIAKINALKSASDDYWAKMRDGYGRGTVGLAAMNEYLDHMRTVFTGLGPAGAVALQDWTVRSKDFADQAERIQRAMQLVSDSDFLRYLVDRAKNATPEQGTGPAEEAEQMALDMAHRHAEAFDAGTETAGDYRKSLLDIRDSIASLASAGPGGVAAIREINAMLREQAVAARDAAMAEEELARQSAIASMEARGDKFGAARAKNDDDYKKRSMEIATRAGAEEKANPAGATDIRNNAIQEISDLAEQHQAVQEQINLEEEASKRAHGDRLVDQEFSAGRIQLDTYKTFLEQRLAALQAFHAAQYDLTQEQNDALLAEEEAYNAKIQDTQDKMEKFSTAMQDQVEKGVSGYATKGLDEVESRITKILGGADSIGGMIAGTLAGMVKTGLTDAIKQSFSSNAVADWFTKQFGVTSRNPKDTGKEALPATAAAAAQVLAGAGGTVAGKAATGAPGADAANPTQVAAVKLTDAGAKIAGAAVAHVAAAVAHTGAAAAHAGAAAAHVAAATNLNVAAGAIESAAAASGAAGGGGGGGIMGGLGMWGAVAGIGIGLLGGLLHGGGSNTVNPQIVSEGGHTINVNIDNFHNQREGDIQGLASQLAYHYNNELKVK